MPSGDHYFTETVLPSSDRYSIETVAPSGDHCFIETVLPSSDQYSIDSSAHLVIIASLRAVDNVTTLFRVWPMRFQQLQRKFERPPF